MERPDPYRPPRADLSQRRAPAASAAITRTMIESLVKTRPWVLLIGIVMTVGCVFMLFAGLAMFALGNIAGFGGQGLGPMAGAWMGAAYLVFAVLYFFPALYLLRYAGRHQEDRTGEPGGDGRGARAPGIVLAARRDPHRPAHRSLRSRDCGGRRDGGDRRGHACLTD